MHPRDMRIDGYPLFSDLRQSELTRESVRRANAEIRAAKDAARAANQAVRNAKRRHAWAERWLERSGAYPPSYSPASLLLDIEEALRTLATHPASTPASPAACELLVHPAFFRRRRPRHGNQGVVRFPRRRGQFQGTRLPQPPEAA